jgi:hypothetical protein
MHIENQSSYQFHTKFQNEKEIILVDLLRILTTATPMKCGLSIPVFVTIKSKILFNRVALSIIIFGRTILKNENSTDYNSTYSYLLN